MASFWKTLRRSTKKALTSFPVRACNKIGFVLGKRLQPTTTRPPGPSSNASIRIGTSRNARIVSAFVRKCSVKWVTVNTLRPAAKARGRSNWSAE